MDISASQYSGASESGWTHYLDQSSLSQSYFSRRGGINVEYEEGKGARRMEESEEEDLSMVSDASSGPPHYDNNECYCENWYPYISSTTKESQKKKKKVKEYGKSQQQPSPLDDTASSPVFSCHKKQDSFSGNGAVESALDFSQCVSATTIKRKTKFQKHFSFFECSKLASEEPDGEERK